MDSYVGEITEFLQLQNVEKSTVVVFTSDNGPWEAKSYLAGNSAPYNGAWQKGRGGSSSKMETPHLTTARGRKEEVVPLARWKLRTLQRRVAERKRWFL